MSNMPYESDIRVSCNYKKMLAIPDHIYFDIFDSNDDCLGGLLGAWSVDIFDDGAPADLGDYEIWLECEAESQDADIRTQTLAFLNRFIDTFGFDELNTTAEEVAKLSNAQIKILTENIK